MSTELYPGIAFSPQAALADNIGAADTIIKVTDVSAFPDAPNLATIGTDEEGETIFYAAKTADALSGCVRGVEGTAKAWSAGEVIGRNWTAKDHTDLIAAVTENRSASAAAQTAAESAARAANAASEALSTKQNKLSGTPGQVVGFSADGSAAAVRGWSNPNLLDNSHFVDPINQRGKTKYTEVGYTIDRWTLNTIGGFVTVDSDGLTIARGEGFFNFLQLVDTPKNLAGKTITFSAIVSNSGFTLDVDGSYPIRAFSNDTGIELVSFTYTLPNVLAKLAVIAQTTGGANQSGKLIAAKLELGTQQTLAHQDASGNWVLNDPPPNKALELLKCQRYYQTGRYAGTARNNGHFNIQFPVEMRATPAISISNVQVFTSTYVDQSGKYGSNIVPTSKTNTRFKIDQTFYDGFMTAAFSWTADANL